MTYHLTLGLRAVTLHLIDGGCKRTARRIAQEALSHPWPPLTSLWH